MSVIGRIGFLLSQAFDLPLIALRFVLFAQLVEEYLFMNGTTKGVKQKVTWGQRS